MTGFVVILAALQLAAPVHCYQSTQAWNQQADAIGGNRTWQAYYNPNVREIGLSPATCALVRKPTLLGANILAHELAHVWQDDQGRALNEGEADRIALATQGWVLRRLVRVLGRAPVVVKPDRPIVLSP